MLLHEAPVQSKTIRSVALAIGGIALLAFAATRTPAAPARHRPTPAGASPAPRAHMPPPADRVIDEPSIDHAVAIGDGEAAEWLASIAASTHALANLAAVALGRIEDPAAGDALLAIASSDAPVLARANAAHALALCGNRSQLSTLAALLSDASQPPRVREESALAIARIGGESAVPLLTEAISSIDEPALRNAVLQAIGEIDAAAARAAR